MYCSKHRLARLLSAAGALGLWQILAMAVGSKLLLVSPVTVFLRLTHLMLERTLWETVVFSLSRIALGFFIAFLLGTLAAFAAGRYRIVEILLWPYMVTIKTVPVASFIIIALIWLSASQLSVFISFLMVFPILYTNILQGIKSTDRSLLEMASLYRISFWRKVHYILIPQIKSYLLSGCSVALGLTWKAGVAAEVISVASGSIGEKLYEAKIYFENADLLAWTVIIVLVSVLFEKGVLFLLRLAFQELEKK